MNNMTEMTQIRVGQDTNLRIKRYVLFIEEILQQYITANIAVTEFLNFIDKYSDLFKKFIESLKEEEVTENGAATE